MKKVIFLASTILVLTLGLSSAALGQYDDLYYDPDRDAGNYSTTIDRSRPVDEPAASRYDEGENYGNNTASYGQGYDDDEYDYYDDYDYYYSSRIRRFHRPYYGFSYYDPCYADLYYYDPYINPGVTVLIYDGFSSWNSWRSWRRFNRWNSWNSFNQGYYGWGSSWNRWNDPWYGGGGWNNGYYGYGNNYYVNNYYGGGWNNWGGGGWNNWGGNGYYCPPSWGNGYNYNTVNTNNNTYFGPRTTGSTLVPRKNDRSPGVQKPETGPLVPKEERQTTVSGSGLSPQPGSGRSYDRPAMEDGKTRTGVEGTGSPETPTRNTRPAVQDRNPVIERPTREGSTPSRPKYDEPQTPRREPAPSRQDVTPSQPRTYEPSTPSRQDVTPAPTRKKDDSPAREYRQRSSSNNTGYERSRSTETPRTSTPSRSYDNSSSRQSTPSRSYNNNSGSSRQASPAPSRSNDGGGSSKSSSPSRSNDNSSKSRSGGRGNGNGG